MDNFYDLNDFIAYILRKWKLIIVIVCVGIIGFAGVRFQGLYQEYQTSQNQPTEVTETAEQTSEPMKCWTEISINVGPNYEVVGTTGISRGNEIANAYNAVKNDDEIMNQMHDQYFEQARVYGDRMRELMSTYGYILDKEKNYEYVEYDFRKQFSVSVNQNYVTIGFYSLNEEFSREVTEAYEILLTAEVEKQYPDFEYTKVAEATRYELPETSAGASPTRSAGSSTTTAATMSMTTVVTQTIKGCVWGAIIGAVAALVIVFFMYMMSRKLILWTQVERNGIKTYGLYYKKKAGTIGKMWRKLIAKLEGNQTTFVKADELAEIVAADTSSRCQENEKILVYGNGVSKKTAKILVDAFNKKSSFERFILTESPLGSAKGIQDAQENSYVIVLETIGVSLKEEIEKEIQAFNGYHVEIVGIIGVE